MQKCGQACVMSGRPQAVFPDHSLCVEQDDDSVVTAQILCSACMALRMGASGYVNSQAEEHEQDSASFISLC